MKSQNVIVFIIVAIIGALIFWKRDEIKQKFGFGAENASGGSITKSDGGSSSGSTTIPVNTGTNYVECTSLPIKLGCKGERVKNLQKTLNKAYKSGISEDGYFGQQTKAALLANGYREIVDVDDQYNILLDSL